jgi:hypothetical protein
MWRRVLLVWTNVSEEHIASIFRVEKSANEEEAWAGGCRQEQIWHRLMIRYDNITVLGSAPFIRGWMLCASKKMPQSDVKDPNGWLFTSVKLAVPIAVTARLRHELSWLAQTLGIVGSNPIRGMDVCIVCIYSVCVVLCAGRGLTTGWSPVQRVLPTVCTIKKLKKRPRPNKEL